ncbi:hypothetical protein FUAX_53650 (plasmid) [Fulvitalea axinellae]|uniref:Uncharacterized protein n=1 Tax=Fulvitalea axinellae TaxID=1182444 RepID=A0AAU9CYA7_9BACT|nr:hypothetical protein FUAX_53650 [Fulvitalea axinellae]
MGKSGVYDMPDFLRLAGFLFNKDYPRKEEKKREKKEKKGAFTFGRGPGGAVRSDGGVDNSSGFRTFPWRFIILFCLFLFARMRSLC